MSAAIKRLRRVEAARYVRETYGVPCSLALLEKLAVVGGGPVSVYFGRFPLYTTTDLDAWVEGKLSPPVRSTSEDRGHVR